MIRYARAAGLDTASLNASLQALLIPFHTASAGAALAQSAAGGALLGGPSGSNALSVPLVGYVRSKDSARGSISSVRGIGLGLRSGGGLAAMVDQEQKGVSHHALKFSPFYMYETGGFYDDPSDSSAFDPNGDPAAAADSSRLNNNDTQYRKC